VELLANAHGRLKMATLSLTALSVSTRLLSTRSYLIMDDDDVGFNYQVFDIIGMYGTAIDSSAGANIFSTQVTWSSTEHSA
jgi:hypothetical protein